MADNVTITPGAGATVTTNQQSSGSAHIQVIQPSYGPDQGGSGNNTWVDLPGKGLPVQMHQPTTQSLTWAAINISSSGDNTVIASSGSKTIRVFALMFTVASQVNITFKDSSPSNLTGAMTFLIGMVLGHTGEPWFLVSASHAFIMNLSSGVQVSGSIGYTQS